MVINNHLACKIAKNLKHIKISRLIFKNHPLEINKLTLPITVKWTPRVFARLLGCSSPVFVNGTPKSFATVFSYQIIDGLLVFIHLHDGSPLPAGLRKRIG